MHIGKRNRLPTEITGGGGGPTSNTHTETYLPEPASEISEATNFLETQPGQVSTSVGA